MSAPKELGQFVTTDLGRVKQAIEEVLAKVVTDENAKKMTGDLVSRLGVDGLGDSAAQFDLRKVTTVAKEAAISLAQKADATLTGSPLEDATAKLGAGLVKIIEGVDAKEKDAMLKNLVSKEGIADLTAKAVEHLPEADRGNADKIKELGDKIEKGLKSLVDGSAGNLVTRAKDAMQMKPGASIGLGLVAAAIGVFSFKSGTAKTDEQGQEVRQSSFWKKALGALLVVGAGVAAVQGHKGISNALGEGAKDIKGYWTALVKNQGQNISGVNLFTR